MIDPLILTLEERIELLEGLIRHDQCLILELEQELKSVRSDNVALREELERYHRRVKTLDGRLRAVRAILG